jgi:hypothetical protein
MRMPGILHKTNTINVVIIYGDLVGIESKYSSNVSDT